MKKIILVLCLVLFSQNRMVAQVEFELKPSQSMSITGKGAGQDAAINPYSGQNCYAIIENVGEKEFSIRTQKSERIIETIPIRKGEIKKVKLLLGYELYFDTDGKGKARAKVEFEKLTE